MVNDRVEWHRLLILLPPVYWCLACCTLTLPPIIMHHATPWAIHYLSLHKDHGRNHLKWSILFIIGTFPQWNSSLEWIRWVDGWGGIFSMPAGLLITSSYVYHYIPLPFNISQIGRGYSGSQASTKALIRGRCWYLMLGNSLQVGGGDEPILSLSPTLIVSLL